MASLLSGTMDHVLIQASYVTAEYQFRLEALREVAARKDRVVAELRQGLMDGVRELSQDALECAVRTMAAIHRGDADEAYAFARACVRTVRCVHEGSVVLSGGTMPRCFD